MRLVAIMAATMAFASPSWAASAPEPQSIEAQSEAVTNWLSRIASWTNEYLGLYETNLETLGHLVDGAEALVLKLDEKNPAQAREWAHQWGPQARARLAAEKEQYQAISTRMPAFPSSVPLAAEDRRRIENSSAFADLMGSMLIRNWQAAESYIADLEASTGGREADLIRIEGSRMGLMIAQLEAENGFVGAQARNIQGPANPYLLSSIESNKATIAWMSNNRLRFTDQPDDPVQTARVMREHAARMRELAAQLTTEINAAEREIRSQPQLMQTQLGTVLSRLLATYRDTHATELVIADRLDALAATVLTGDQEDVDLAAANLDAAIQRRIEIDDGRRQLAIAAGS